ncbi:hypothetical protein [Chromobacterium paludis]|uniref:Uncharacterized protein n=1 Tax=Chromobacterium paludis TaxID=2605945 RepID=A0A5C1DF40_9NEIS|nr:hypothetical protein [Chromobacterium paludis]QEL55133.1 hypothetical protein FYK34_05910 [Chromobacterium paludis]
MIDPTDQQKTAFISFHEILFIIAQAKEWAPQVAAQSLSQTLHNDATWSRLQLSTYDVARGVSAATRTESSEAYLALGRLARFGDWKDPDDIPF